MARTSYVTADLPFRVIKVTSTMEPVAGLQLSGADVAYTVHVDIGPLSKPQHMNSNCQHIDLNLSVSLVDVENFESSEWDKLFIFIFFLAKSIVWNGRVFSRDLLTGWESMTSFARTGGGCGSNSKTRGFAQGGLQGIIQGKIILVSGSAYSRMALDWFWGI